MSFHDSLVCQRKLLPQFGGVLMQPDTVISILTTCCLT